MLVTKGRKKWISSSSWGKREGGGGRGRRGGEEGGGGLGLKMWWGCRGGWGGQRPPPHSVDPYLLQRLVRLHPLLHRVAVRVPDQDLGEELGRDDGVGGGELREGRVALDHRLPLGEALLARHEVDHEAFEPNVFCSDLSEGCGPVEELGQGGVEVLALLRPDGVHEQLTEHAAVLPPLVVVLVLHDLKEAQLEAPDATQRGRDRHRRGGGLGDGAAEVRGEDEVVPDGAGAELGQEHGAGVGGADYADYGRDRWVVRRGGDDE